MRLLFVLVSLHVLLTTSASLVLGSASAQGLVTAAQLRQQLATQGVHVSPAARMWWIQNTGLPPSVARIEAEAPPTPFTDRLLAQARGLDPPPRLQWPPIEEQPRTFAHDGMLVFASRPGWSVLAGPQAARSQRQRELKEFGVAARRKVARSLVDSAALTPEAAPNVATPTASMMKGGNKASTSVNSGANRSNSKVLHQEISQARRIFTALMLDADVSRASKGGGSKIGGVGKMHQQREMQQRQVSSQRRVAEASRTNDNDDEDMVVDRETFAHNLRRLLQRAQAKRWA